MAVPLTISPTTGAISIAPPAAPGSTTIQPGYTVPNTGKTYTVGGQTFNQFGDPVAAPAVTPAPPTSIAPAIAPPVYAPKFDTAAVAAKARADATGAVNPYYTAELNKFLTQQGALQQQKQTQDATDVQNFKDTLDETLKNNALTGDRTSQDTATKIGDINKSTDQFQQDSGDSFEVAREAQARAQSAAGVLGSGAGNRQTNTAIVTRNTTEGRAVDKAQEQKDAAELFKARTFEDLATSNASATKTEGKQESQATFDLNNYIHNLNYQTDAQRDALDKARQGEIEATTQTLAKTAYNNYINGIANPAQRVAAAQTYGGSF